MTIANVGQATESGLAPVELAAPELAAPELSALAGTIDDGLARLRATAGVEGGPWPLTSITLPIPDIEPIALFSAARSLDLEAALWLQPSTGRSIVGIGRAWAVQADGPDRFSRSAAAWREVLADSLRSGERAVKPKAGPVLLGGLGFTGDRPLPGDLWEPFGAASLVLPTFGVTQDGPATHLTVAIGPAATEDGRQGALGKRWADLQDRAREPQHRMVGIGSPDLCGGSSERVASPLVSTGGSPDRAAWDRIVGMYAGAVGRGRLDKVVLARREGFRAPAEIDIEATLRHLAATAPECTIFAFARGGTTFLGASPERLVRTTGRSFETVAIAGSAARGRDATEDAELAAWLLANEKEREEHAVVVDTLRANLEPIVETLQVPDAPTILPLRHVQHLVTPISGRLLEEAGLLALAERLHPTPAVGGSPRDMALDLIVEHEGFERGWYAGPIGWLGSDGDGELMVALRCALVAGAEAVLFAGCGIVADSDPAREWEESRLKLRTMGTALGGIGGDDT